ncbi:hypothetical protein J7K50_03755 [bacterium]|nr:hypothetical protein [bacterium]
MRLHPVRCGIALGITHAALLFVVSVLAGLFSWGNEWVHFFSMLYIGYNTTIVGIAFGVIWSFFAGFGLGWIFSVVFNFLDYLDQSDEYD